MLNSTDEHVHSETSSGHSHSHDHPHPHAEPESPSSDPDEDEDHDALALPNRLDRLLAFLSSYFGQVELINPEDNPIADVEPKEEVEEVVEAKDENMVVVEEGDEETKVKIEHPRVPVIRVRLDEHVADVNVEDMVRPLSHPRRSFADAVPLIDRHIGERASAAPSRVGDCTGTVDRHSP